ncbi:MAG: alpha/beta fold hydrolase [bacterium]
MNERAVLFGKSKSLVGIITETPADAKINGKPAIILLNAGFIHRVGPNRLYVNLARCLANHGFLSVRFDHSGIGDSLPRTDSTNYAESYNSEVQEVMDWLAKTYNVDRFCLIGLCSGARTSFSVACCDSRVVGAVFLNPRGLAGSIDWIMYVENRWQIRELLTKFFTPRGFWKTFTGKAPYLRAIKVVRNQFKNLFKRHKDVASEGSEISQSLNSLIERKFRLLWISSEWDASQEYFKLITDGDSKNLRSHELISFSIITDTNHTFDTLQAQEQVLSIIEAWAVRGWSETPVAQTDFMRCKEGI